MVTATVGENVTVWSAMSVQRMMAVVGMMVPAVPENVQVAVVYAPAFLVMPLSCTSRARKSPTAPSGSRPL